MERPADLSWRRSEAMAALCEAVKMRADRISFPAFPALPPSCRQQPDRPAIGVLSLRSRPSIRPWRIHPHPALARPARLRPRRRRHRLGNLYPGRRPGGPRRHPRAARPADHHRQAPGLRQLAPPRPGARLSGGLGAATGGRPALCRGNRPGPRTARRACPKHPAERRHQPAPGPARRPRAGRPRARRPRPDPPRHAAGRPARRPERQRAGAGLARGNPAAAHPALPGLVDVVIPQRRIGTG